MLHAEFASWMEKDWLWEGDLVASLKGLSEKLIAWNRDVFGSIFRRKRRVKSRMEGVMRALDETPAMV